MCRAVLGVLAGSQPALVEATRSWPELLVALLLHTQPAARPQLDLRPLLRRSRQLRDRADGGESAEPPPPPLPPLASLPEMLLVHLAASLYLFCAMPTSVHRLVSDRIFQTELCVIFLFLMIS